MSTTREHAIRLINDLPDTASLDDVLERLYFQEQVERGLRELETGRAISHDELRERKAQWRKPAG